MLTLDSRDEEALRLLLLDPERPGDVSRAAREAARRIRHVFLRQRGWAFVDLLPFRFRDLADLAQSGEVALCRLRGPAEWTRGQDDLTLRLALAELSTTPREVRPQALAALTGGPAVDTVLIEKKLALSPQEWAYVERLVAERDARTEKKSRVSGAQLGAGIVRLLEAAYGGRA